jgi:PAS domain S-box-containing protein
MDRGIEAQQRVKSPQKSERDYEMLRLTKELEWLRTLAHVSPVGIIRHNAQGRCTFVNERWSELSGYSAQMAMSNGWELPVHPDDVRALSKEWRRCQADHLPFRMEHRYLHPNGRVVWVLSEVVREVDGRGRTLGYTGMVTEVTELRQMREELQRSHNELSIRMRDRVAELQRMGRIVETIDDAVFSQDMNGNVLSWNHGAEKIFGYTAAELMGQRTLVLAREDRKQHAVNFENRVRSGEEIHHFETVMITKAGAPIEVEISGFPLRDAFGKIYGSWAIIRDITERKKAERRLQRLSWRLLRIQDEERRRLARELHDSTAQSLAALAMNLSALSREDSPLTPARRQQLLLDSTQLAEHATSELRTTSYLLHPPLLDERGLCAALSWFISGFSKRSGVEVKLEIAPEVERLDVNVETALFRVVQESLHNVHRHSGSGTCEVHLGLEDGQLVLEIRDFGRGLPPGTGDALGVGISGMKERLHQIGGTLTITPQQPGTSVVARLTQTK